MHTLRVMRLGLLVGWREFSRFWTPVTWVLGWMARILGQATFFALLGELLDSEASVRFLLIGNSVVVGAMAANWAVPASTWDRSSGVYPLLVIAPTSMLPAIIGRTSIWMVNGIASSLMAFLVLGLVFGVHLPLPEALLLMLLVPVTCVSAFTFALFMGCLVARMPRLRNILFLNATSLAMVICGVSVPVAYWPATVEVIANLLPLTHGLHAIRLLLDGSSPRPILEATAMELVVASAWLLVSILLMDRLANAGRRDGSIELA